MQCGIAKQCPENVIAFFLEDDYLVVDPTMFCVVDEAFEKFGVDGINPHWHPKGGCGRVGEAKPDFVSGGVSFGRIDNSCCTFAVRSQLFRENEKDFLNYGRTCRENEAFNPVWARSRFYGVFNGTMMEHLHRCELSGAGAIKAVNPK